MRSGGIDKSEEKWYKQGSLEEINLQFSWVTADTRAAGKGADMQALSVTVITGRRQGVTKQVEGAAWASLDIQGRPTKQRLDLRVAADPEVVLLAVFDRPGRPNPCLGATRTLSFEVPVKWNHNTPHTRERGEDNVDLVLLDQRTRKLTVLQTGLFTRSGRFYVFIQRTWEGWIKGSNRDLKFIPTSPYAYQGNEFGKAFSGLAVLVKNQIPSLSRGGEMVQEPVGVEEGVWNPNFPPALSSWEPGVVLFFNVLTGIGRIVDCESGKVHMLHFSTRVVENTPGMEIPCPGQGVYYRPGPEEEDFKVKSWKIA